MSQPWQVSYCTTGAAIWGESGRTPCRFPPLFVYSKSCRTTWSCALPKTKINSVVVQHCNPERALLLERHAVCMLWWLACSPVSVLPSQGRFLFPSSPRIHNFPCDFIYKKLIFPGQQWVVSLSSWELLRDGSLGGEWRACKLGDLWGGEHFLNASVLGSFWEWTTHVLCLPTSEEQTGCRHEGSWPWSTWEAKWSLSFWQYPGFSEKAAWFSHVSEGLAEFLGCFLCLPASNSHEMSARNELQECSCTRLQYCAAMATSAKP